MHNIHDKESLRTEAPQLKLRELDADSSDSLIEYLDKIQKLDIIVSSDSMLRKGS
jgi:hypothetical protein